MSQSPQELPDPPPEAERLFVEALVRLGAERERELAKE